MAQARLLHLLKLALFTNGLLKVKSLALHVSSLGRSVDQPIISCWSGLPTLPRAMPATHLPSPGLVGPSGWFGAEVRRGGYVEDGRRLWNLECAVKGEASDGVEAQEGKATFFGPSSFGRR
jgi:hypothetical protein